MEKTIEQVLDNNREALLSIPGVVGVGITKLNDEPVIMVMILKQSTKLKKLLPDKLDGYPVVIEITGEFKANDK